MKSFYLFILLTVVTFNSYSQNSKKDFYGMWTLDIGERKVGWLEVGEKNGYLDASLLWIGGSVVPVSHVYFQDDNTLVVTRTYSSDKGNDRKHTVTQTFTFIRNGDRVTGIYTNPYSNGEAVSKEGFHGWRLPDVGPAPDLSKIEYGKEIKLFNGKDLSGWRMIDPNTKNGFSVVKGDLVNNPVHKDGEHAHYGNLRTEAEFEDFNLTLEVNIPENNNSGIYLRGIYEVQVLDSYGKDLDSHNMGALYSRITPSVNAEKPAGKWQKVDITLYKRHVTVVLNGTTIIDNKPVYGPTGGAISPDVFKAGPIYLQGDHGMVSYRKIELKPILN